jgi:hypothetical protein
MYWSGSQFYNLHSNEMDLEENEKIIELIQKASQVEAFFVLHASQENADKEKGKKES